MTTKENYHFQNRFMGVPVKCSSEYPSLKEIIEALYVMTYGCVKSHTRQRGYHVRIRFTEKMDSRKFSARLTTFFRRKSNYIPLRLTVAESDQDEKGLHYHFAIILNDRLDRKSSLNHLMAKLMDGGFLSDYKVIAPKSNPYGHHLQMLEDKDSFFEWMSYLAKVATKAEIGQVWSPCRCVSQAVKLWKTAGKPDLRRDFHLKESQDCAVSDNTSFVMPYIDILSNGIRSSSAPTERYGTP